MSAPIVHLPGLVQILPRYTPDPDTNNHPSNVLWFLQRAPGSLSISQLTTIGNAFDLLWAPVFLAYGANSMKYLGCITTDFSTNTGLQWSTVGTFSGASGVNGGSLPPNVAFLISLSIQQRYRGGHGRIYLPWVGSGTQSSSDPSAIVGTYVTNVATKYSLVEPGMNAIAVGGGLTQRVYRNRTNAATATLFPITTFNVQNLYATQRRRLRKAPHH